MSKFIPEWRKLAEVGHRTGPARSAVTIIEFADFECPACRAFAKTLRLIHAKYPNDVSVVFRHLPLGAIHPSAWDAARASECAAKEASFERVSDVLFAAQDSLGIVPWASLAARAGVLHLGAFNLCMASTTPDSTVRRDSIVAGQLGSRSTPTVIVNGMRFAGGVPFGVLDSLVRQVRVNPRKGEPSGDPVSGGKVVPGSVRP
ncbi:MAG: DsbA family protein [Gemmatimonadaceae bacterium]